MINSNSRYANSQVLLIDDPDEPTARVVIVPSQAKPYQFQFLFHIVTGVENNRVDLIAANYYGDSQLWWKIADANPEILNWGNLETGTVIRIPKI